LLAVPVQNYRRFFQLPCEVDGGVGVDKVSSSCQEEKKGDQDKEGNKSSFAPAQDVSSLQRVFSMPLFGKDIKGDEANEP
jgi:hypothetical protein